VNQVLERIRDTIPLFRGLTLIQLREFLADSRVHRLRAGQVVFERNDFTDSFYTILEGGVEAIVPASDSDAADDGLELERQKRERAFRSIPLGAGQFFGEGSLLSGRRRSATVKAASDCVLIETPRLATNKLIKSVPEVRRVMDQTFIARQIENMLPQVPKQELERLAQAAEVLAFKQGETVFKEGDDPDGLHLLRRGSVSISQTRAGREVVINLVPAGNVVGEMALLGPGRKRGATVRAAVYTETVRLPTTSFLPVLQRHVDVRQMLEGLEDQRSTQLLRAREEGATDLISFLLNADVGGGEATDLLLIDESLCVRCDNCEKACADTHGGVTRLNREAGSSFGQIHVPIACRHCENPKCMTDCPPDAIRRNPNGEVYILDNCIGCGNCSHYCPYGVIQMAAVDPNPRPGLLARLLFGRQADPRHVPPELANDDASKHAVKCDLCVGLPQFRKKSPPTSACVAACPTGAIIRTHPAKFVEELQGGGA
jgi:CRP-like cAMP-binding protein/Fe-S-cluster-containing dehydrogenase component